RVAEDEVIIGAAIDHVIGRTANEDVLGQASLDSIVAADGEVARVDPHRVDNLAACEVPGPAGTERSNHLARSRIDVLHAAEVAQDDVSTAAAGDVVIAKTAKDHERQG